MGLSCSCCTTNASLDTSATNDSVNDIESENDPELNVDHTIKTSSPQLGYNNLIISAVSPRLQPHEFFRRKLSPNICETNEIIEEEVSSDGIESSFLLGDKHFPNEPTKINFELPKKKSKRYKKKKKKPQSDSNLEVNGCLQKCQLSNKELNSEVSDVSQITIDVMQVLTDGVNTVLVDERLLPKWNRFEKKIPCQIFEIGGECFVEKKEWGDEYMEFDVLTDTESLEDEDVSWNGSHYNIGYHSWNMVSTLNSNEFYCMACRTNGLLSSLKTHCNHHKHVQILQNMHIVDAFDKCLVRKVDAKYYHCGYCNSLQLKDNMEYHIEMKHSKSKSNGKIHQQHLDGVKTGNSVGDCTGKCDDIDLKILGNTIQYENENRNPNNGFVNVFGSKIKVNSLHFIFESQTGYFCGLCQTTMAYDSIQQHIKDLHHSHLIQRHPFIKEYGGHLLRHFTGGLHCAICHIVIHDIDFVIRKHIQDEQHILLRTNALISKNGNLNVRHVNPIANNQNTSLTVASNLHVTNIEQDTNLNGFDVYQESSDHNISWSHRNGKIDSVVNKKKKKLNHENLNQDGRFQQGGNIPHLNQTNSSEFVSGQLHDISKNQRDCTKEVLLVPYNNNVLNTKSGTKHTPAPAQIENISMNLTLSNDYEMKEMIVDGIAYKLRPDAWHSLCVINGGLKCILCDVIIQNNKALHVKSISHLKSLTIHFQLQYLPALIRQATNNAHCCTCNTQIPNTNLNITEHVKGKSHLQKIKLYLKS